MASESPSCKFCGNDCEPKKYEGVELDMCGQCFRQWKKIVRNT